MSRWNALSLGRRDGSLTVIGDVRKAARKLIRSERIKAAALTSGAAEEFAKAYVAGRGVDQCAAVARRLTSQGLQISLAYLPLSEDESETPAALQDALDELGALARGAEISLKPSSIGLRESLCSAQTQLEQLCQRVTQAGAHITLEMQGDRHFDDTLQLWQSMRSQYPDLGLTLPADIQRCEDVVGQLAVDGARIRLCVGSYPLVENAGYRREHDKSLALVRLLRRTMEAGGYPMVASHHPTIIAITQDLAHKAGLGPSGFEFQMFYGVRPLEQRRLADIGYQSRTYIPFGPAWFEYLTTRIAARPRTLYSYLRAIGDKR